MSSLQSIRQVLGKAKRGAYYQLLSNQDDSDFDSITSNFSTSSKLFSKTLYCIYSYY